MRNLLSILCLCVLSFSSFGQDTVQVMFYNLFRFPSSPPKDRELILKEIVDSIRPDLLMACEIVDEDGVERIVNYSLSGLPDSFASAEFHYSESAIADPLQQAVFYNTRKLTLRDQVVWTTPIRDINQYSFLLNTSESSYDPVYLEVFVAHFKSSDGAANRALRLMMADTFVRALTGLPGDRHVLFSGDFNLYSDNEPAYQRILDSTNTIRMLDPIAQPGEWHNNSSFSKIHTQSTRVSSAGFGLGGATGGLDDRFDFILISEKTLIDPRFRYLQDTYEAYGNNGNCFDKSIHDTSCIGKYSLEMRKKLHDMSDHTPVVMQFITNQRFPTGITGAAPTGNILFPNGNVVNDELFLSLDTKTPAVSVIVVYDHLGRRVLEKHVGPTSRKITLDVRQLSTGLYFIRTDRYPESAHRFFKM